MPSEVDTHGPWTTDAQVYIHPRKQNAKRAYPPVNPHDSEVQKHPEAWSYPSVTLRTQVIPGAIGWRLEHTNRVFSSGSAVYAAVFFDTAGRELCRRDAIRLVGRFKPHRINYKHM